MGWLERMDARNQLAVERENARGPIGTVPPARWLTRLNRAARWWRIAMVMWAAVSIVGALFTGNWPNALVALVVGGLAALHLIAQSPRSGA
jgi:hypothetical protein